LFLENEVPFGKFVLFVIFEYELSHNGTIPQSIFIDKVHAISIYTQKSLQTFKVIVEFESNNTFLI